MYNENIDKIDEMMNPDYLSDYASKCLVIEETISMVKVDAQKFVEERDRQILSAEQTLTNSEVACSEKSAEIENKAQADIVKAGSKKESEIAASGNRMKIAEDNKMDSLNRCEDRKVALQAESEKIRHSLAEKFNLESQNEKARYATVVDEHSQSIAAHQKAHTEKMATVVSSYEKNVKNIEEKIATLHAEYKQSDSVNFSQYNKIKVDRDEKIKMKKAEFEKREQSLNSQFKNCNDKQKLKTIKNEIALNKSSYSATEKVMQDDISTAKKIYDSKAAAAYAKICAEITEQQRQLRVLKNNFEFDKAKLCEEKKVADVKLLNEKFKEERQNIENVLEIDLNNQSKIEIQKATELCNSLDLESSLQQIQSLFDTKTAEEEKALECSELSYQECLNTIDCNKRMNLQEQQQKIAEALSKKNKLVKIAMAECHHKIQVEKIDLLSLCVKTANKNEKLLNSFKSKKISDLVQKQIAKERARLAEDATVINAMKEAQNAENKKLIETTKALFEKQMACLQSMLADCVEKDDETEIELLTKNIAMVKISFETTAKDNAVQHDDIIKMFDNEQLLIQQEAETKIVQLQSFVSSIDATIEKNNNRSDERMSATEDCKKDMVVKLFENFEKELKFIEEECTSTNEREKNVLHDVTDNATVEKEKFIQYTADKKAKAEEICLQKINALESKKQQFANETEKNKKTAVGLKEEKILNNTNALKAKQSETAQLVAGKIAECKQLEVAIEKKILEERKTNERSVVEIAKLKDREEKWLAKNGKVDYTNSWWIVDFSK